MGHKIFAIVSAILSASVLGGCSHHYVTPGAGVSIAAIASIDDAGIQQAYARQPASPLPARLALVRVQDSGYVSETSHGYGHGRYSVVTTRDIESDAALAKIEQQPMLAALAPLSRLLIPPGADSIRDLRRPAAQLQTDMLLIYSVDTVFTVDGHPLGPLSAISLGLIPNQTAHVTSTVAGVLVDVRTGFIYGATEATAKEHQRTSIWSTRMVTDAARLEAEARAFDAFAGEFVGLWSAVLQTHAARPAGFALPAGTAPPRPSADSDRWYRIDF